MDRAVFWPEYFAPSWDLNRGQRLRSGHFYRLGYFVIHQVSNGPFASDPPLFSLHDRGLCEAALPCVFPPGPESFVSHFKNGDFLAQRVELSAPSFGGAGPSPGSSTFLALPGNRTPDRAVFPKVLAFRPRGEARARVRRLVFPWVWAEREDILS